MKLYINNRTDVDTNTGRNFTYKYGRSGYTFLRSFTWMGINASCSYYTIMFDNIPVYLITYLEQYGFNLSK